MHRVSLASCVLSLSIAAGLSAQSKTETAGLLVRLGNDTIAAERFTRSPGRLEGDLVALVPRPRLVHYVATLNAKGVVTRLESSSQPYAAGSPKQSAVATMGTDTVTEELRLGDSSWTQKIAVRPGAVPMLSFSFALYEQAIRQALATGKDSVNVDIVFMGPNRAFPTALAKHGPDSMMVEYFGNPAYVKIDKQGRLLGWNGLATTQKFLVDRLPTVNVEVYGKAWAARETAGEAVGPLSPRDTVRATVGSAQLLVDYGRPRRRGRVIFGNVIPWGAVWRTGANAATGFSTDKDLVISGVAVPAGDYTLWTVPEPNGGQLIINSQTKQWGTEYDAAKDFAKIPLQQEKLSEPVDQFTISIVPDSAGTGAVLRMEWEQTRYSATIGVKP
jgi:hypothetical protein